MATNWARVKLVLGRKVRSGKPLIATRSTQSSINIVAQWFWMSKKRFVLETIVIWIDLRLIYFVLNATELWRPNYGSKVRTAHPTKALSNLWFKSRKAYNKPAFSYKSRIVLMIFCPYKASEFQGPTSSLTVGRCRAWQSENAGFLELNVGWLVLCCRKLWGAELGL